MAITQVITAIPQAGHRGVDAQDAFVTKQEAFQDALTDVAVTQLNTFATQANALETNVNAKEASASNSALIAMGSANYKGDWVSAYLGAGYQLGNSVTHSGSNYVSKINNNLATPSGTTDANWLKIVIVAEDATKVLKSGDTMTGALNTTVVDKGTVSTGTVTFTVSAGNAQRLQVGGALTIATNGWAASGVFTDLLVRIVNGGSATVTMPTINWVQPNGTTTTTLATYLTAIKRTGLQASGTDFMYLWSTDAGTTIYGKLA